MILGTIDLDKRLEKMSKADIGLGIHKVLPIIQDAAKLGAPVVTGELRESILTDMEIEGDTVRGICYTNLAYAPYVEFGTGPKGQASHEGISPDVAVAYTQSPWWIHESQVERETAERYGWFYIDTPQGRFYKCSGQPAQPFMYPALKNNEEAIVKMIGRDFRSQL